MVKKKKEDYLNVSQNKVYYFIIIFLATSRSLQDLSSLTRDKPTPSALKAQSFNPLDSQGIPNNLLFFKSC